MRRTAVILPVVLLVLVLIGLLAAMFAFRVHADLSSTQTVALRLQTRLAAEAGVEYVKLVLRTSRYDPSVWYHNPDIFNRMIITAHGHDARVAGTNEEFKETTAFRFSIVADDPTDDKDFARFGITDEASKLNLNTASSAQLLKIVTTALGENKETDPQEIVDSILYWRGDGETRGEAAETQTEYYQNLPKPYRPKGGPFDTAEELLLVKGVTPEVFYGEDFDRNGLVGENEKDGDRTFPADNQDEILNRGLSAYLTVLSSENNVSNDNRPRVNLLGEEAVVRTELAMLFPDEPAVVDYIVTASRSAPPPGGQGGDGGAGGGPPAGSPQGGSPPPGGQVTPGGAGQPAGAQGSPKPPRGGAPLSGSGGPKKPPEGAADQGTQPQGGEQNPSKIERRQQRREPPPGNPPPSTYPPPGSKPNRRGGAPPSAEPSQGPTPQPIPPGDTGQAPGAPPPSEQEPPSSDGQQEEIQDGTEGEGQEEDEQGDGGGGDGSGNPQLRSPASLMLPRTVDGQIVESPLGFEHLAILMDKTTILPATQRSIPGLININTAPRTVLECIDGLSADQIEDILATRPVLDAESASTTAWLVSEGVLDVETFDKVAPQITARGQQFMIESLGFADHVGMVTRLQVVVDLNGPVAQTIYYRDISNLGGAYPIREEDKDKIRAR